MGLNILFVTHHDNFQGSSRSLLSLLEGLQEFNLQPHVVLPKESGFTDALEGQHLPISILPVPWWVTWKPVSFPAKRKITREIFQSVKLIRPLVHENQIDLIYTNSSVTPVGRLAAWFEGIPHIWHIREFVDLDFSLQNIYPEFITKAFVKSSDAVICHAKAVRDHHFKHPQKSVFQIYNGAATRDQFDERLEKRKHSTNNGPLTFAMLSTLSPNKGQETAIRAMAVLKERGMEARLLLAGSGKEAYLSYLEQLVKDLGIKEQVQFLGFIDDPYEVYFDADCALICSENEAFSRVGLEAMSTALPLIGRNSGGTPEVIADGETGILYNTFDELVEAMIRLVQNPQLGREMGMAGWERAKNLFNIEDYAENVYKVIQSVMK